MESNNTPQEFHPQETPPIEDENPVSPAYEVQAENQPPENLPPQPTEPAPPIQTQEGGELPPAAKLVVEGEVTDERQLALQRDLEAAKRRERELETQVAERERDLQELRKVQQPAPKPQRKKPGRFFPTIIGSSEGDE